MKGRYIMEGTELLSFQIISAAGSARSSFVEAIEHAKAGNFEDAEKSMEQGEVEFTEGHKVHAQIIQQEAAGNPVTMGLLLTHAEDQMMSAEVLKVVASELIEVYKRLK